MFVVPASLRFLLPLTCLVSVPNNGVFAANIFDWAPSISLTDNFGVMEGLCPDIAGFGASLNCDVIMQLHTCKARGDDTQFVFDFDSNVIRSVQYDPDCQSISDDKNGACITVDGSISEGDNLRLSPCHQGIDQSFELSMDGKIRTVANSNLCLAKTSDVGPAGPNERTDFALADCDGADPEDVTWTVNPPMPPTPEDTAAPTKTPTALLMTDLPGNNASVISEIDQTVVFDDDLMETENTTGSFEDDGLLTENVTQDNLPST